MYSQQVCMHAFTQYVYMHKCPRLATQNNTENSTCRHKEHHGLIQFPFLSNQDNTSFMENIYTCMHTIWIAALADSRYFLYPTAGHGILISSSQTRPKEHSASVVLKLRQTTSFTECADRTVLCAGSFSRPAIQPMALSNRLLPIPVLDTQLVFYFKASSYRLSLQNLNGSKSLIIVPIQQPDDGEMCNYLL